MNNSLNSLVRYVILLILLNLNLNSQIKILKPSGNEIFQSLKPITIEWNGTKFDDLVSLEYSIDNGQNWNLITNNATNFKYIWDKPPYIDSEKCKIRISNNNLESIYTKPPTTTWQATYGGSSEEYVSNLSIIDNNLYIMGLTFSSDLDAVNSDVINKQYIFKVDKLGKLTKSIFHGDLFSIGYTEIFKLNDTTLHGFSSFNAFKYPNLNSFGKNDFNSFKIDKNDNIYNNKFYGGSENDILYGVVLDKDSNFVLLGSSESKDFDVDCNKGTSNAWLIKLNQNGDILNKYCFGGTGDEIGYRIINTNDNGFLISLISYSLNFEYAKKYGYNDITLIKLDSNLNIEWGNTFGGNMNEVTYKMIQSKDNNYYLVGKSNSFLYDVIDPKGEQDGWIFKVDPTGKLIWSKNYGGFYDDSFNDIVEIDKNQFLVLGQTNSPNGNLINKYGNSDAILMKIDETGNILWQSTFGGKDTDVLSFMKLNGNELYLAGITSSTDGSILENNLNRKTLDSRYDTWLLNLKFDSIETLSDTLNGTFTITPKKIIAKNIDMGEEFVNENKDSTIINYILNDGKYNSNIDNIIISDGDISSFSILNFSKSILNSKNGLDVQFRFTPQKLGLNTSQIAIISDNDTLIQNISGIGKERDFEIQYLNKNLDFGNIRLGKNKDTINFDILKNLGKRKLNISKIEISGNDKNDFEILNNINNIILNENDVLSLNVRFNPNTIGNKNVKINIESDYPQLQNEVDVIGYAYNIPKAKDIDMGQELITESKDSILTNYIFNSENFNFKIDNIKIINGDISSFSVLNFTASILNSKSGLDVQFRFTPQKIGLNTAQIAIISGNDTILYNITGIGKERDFEIAYISQNLDFGNVRLGNSKDTINFEVLKNKGIRKLNITKVEILGIDKNDFEILNNINNLVLNENDILSLNVRFNPNATGNKNAKINIESDYSEMQNEVDVKGFAYNIQKANFNLKMNNLEAFAGEVIELPIIINNINNIIESEVKSINFELNFNPTLLYPIGYTPQIINEKTASILIENVPIKYNEDEIITSIKFKVGLGNAENCDIILKNVSALGGVADISFQDAKFTLLGVCYEGGVRLLNPNSVVSMANISPNPVSSIIKIDLSLIEIGKTEVAIYNLIGEKVKTIFTKDITETGNITINSDINDLSNGHYVVIFTTPTFTDKKNILIIK